MATKTKIKIHDDSALRNRLDLEYESSSQTELCQYALLLAAHILELSQIFHAEDPVIKDGFSVNEQWQRGEARMHDVRQAGFRIHQMAKACENLTEQAILRCVGQAVATGHMREHSMVASDYAVKVINLLHPDNLEAVSRERAWQLAQLEAVKR